jgi:class 3 adenylate cyclase
MGTIPTGTTSREGAPSPIKENKARPESSRTNTPIDQSWSGDESSDIDTGEDEHNPLSATFNSSWSEQEIHKSKQMELHINRTDNLLFKVFPKHIAEALREGRKVEPEEHDMVTIFFSDIVGFTDISATLDPMKICDLLDRLYHAFDALSIIHKVFKVETIGDAYMGVTNMEKSPSQHRDHVRRIAEFAIDAIKVANQTLIDKDDVTKGYVHIRVGFHSGPVVSNVVGTRNPRYCLFGDTVNTASRMESNSAVDRIHCSEESAVLLQEQCGSIQSFPRGAIMVKGKGEMNTFWVHQDGPPEPNTKSKVKKFGKMMKGKNIKKLFGKLKQ